MANFNGKNLKFLNVLLRLLVLYNLFFTIFGITNENNEHFNTFRYCLRKSESSNLKECVGRTALSFLQRFDEKDKLFLADSVIVARDETAASRTLVNFLDTDPLDFRSILENAGAVFSQRSLEFHMDAIYPGLMFKIGPSADSNSVAQFLLDPTVVERNFNNEEPSTARILTKQYVLPFLLGLKFNLAALTPILLTFLYLLLKKSLFIAKLVIYISSILGVGGVASALGTFSGWNGFLGHAGVPPYPHGHGYGAGSLGVYPGKNTVYSHYDQDGLQHNTPYKRHDRKVMFENSGENSRRASGSSGINIRTTEEPMLVTPSADRFYEFEKQILMPKRSGKLRKSDPTSYGEYGDADDVMNRFKTSDSGWKVI